MKNLIIIICIAIGAVTAKAQKIQVGADPNVDIGAYKTYAWAEGSTAANPLIHQIIVDAVDQALTAKGLRKVETQPELMVVVFAATESELHISNPSWTPSMNSISTGIAGGPQGWPVTKGTLVVDISDSKTKNGVWRAQATDTLKQGPSGDRAKDAKNVEKPIRKAVDKMFKQFPRPSRK